MQGLFNVLSSGCHAVKNKTKQQIEKRKKKKKTCSAKGKTGGMCLLFYFSQKAMLREPCDQREDLITGGYAASSFWGGSCLHSNRTTSATG